MKKGLITDFPSEKPFLSALFSYETSSKAHSFAYTVNRYIVLL